MKRFVFFMVLIPSMITAQTINYSPNRKLEKTVAKTYYDTEFIFLNNISESSVQLKFEVIASTLLPEWSTTICTNVQCFSTIPKSGNLGTLSPNEQAYISFNFAANETQGNGQVRFVISSENIQDLNDTITFNYTVNEDGVIKAGPWANVNYKQGVLNVLLENPNIAAEMSIFTSDGHMIFTGPLHPITSIPMRDHPAGIYIVFIKDDNDRIIRQSILKI